MELAAVVVVPGQNDFAFPHGQSLCLSSGTSPAVHSSLLPVLGNYVLRTWTERVHKLGVPSFWLTSEGDEKQISSALGRLAQQGIERLLVIKLKSYAEMDLIDLLQFHCQKRTTVTEAHDSRGQLGVCVIDHLALPAAGENQNTCAMPSGSEHALYPFRGYAKRILSATERQELVGDALTGGCAMRPLGKEVREQVWVGEGVVLDDSVRVVGPTYIGDRTAVRAGATVGPFASVERDCLVDCGTTVERATILPRTYLAPGILVRNALVDGSYLEDLRSGAIADLLPSGLAARMRPAQSVSIPVSGPAERIPRWFGTAASDFAPSSTQWCEL